MLGGLVAVLRRSTERSARSGSRGGDDRPHVIPFLWAFYEHRFLYLRVMSRAVTRDPPRYLIKDLSSEGLFGLRTTAQSPRAGDQ